MKVGDLQAVEEEQNRHGRNIVAGQLRKSGPQGGYLADRNLSDVLLFTTLNSK